MRLAKLCITLALATGGWHAALASALCARRADCHASASPRARVHSQTVSEQTPIHAADEQHRPATQAEAHAADGQYRAATHAAVAPANDPANHRGHCGASAESPRAAAHAAPPEAEPDAAPGDDENVSPAAVADLRAPGSSCAHCVGRLTGQPARVKSAAPAFARDAHAAPVPVRHLATLQPLRPRPRRAPTEHSPPRGRPLHLLNSALLI